MIEKSELVDIILKNFTMDIDFDNEKIIGKNGFIYIKQSDGYGAYTFVDHDELGVAVEYNGDIEIVEVHLNKCWMDMSEYEIDGRVVNVIRLCTKQTKRGVIEWFAEICAKFISLGENNSNRQKLLKDPGAYMAQVAHFIGNKYGEKSTPDVCAELIVYYYLQKSGLEPIWGGKNKTVVDFSTNSYDCEVKSTTQQKVSQFNASSGRQFCNGEHLFFVRFEDKGMGGISINDVVEKLVEIGVSRDLLNEHLAGEGLPQSCHSRTIKHKLYGVTEYLIDDSFPKINESSFINGKYPPGIDDIRYTVNLANVEGGKGIVTGLEDQI